MTEAPFNDKVKQFNDMWDGVTPKGVNSTKSLKFRQYILAHVPKMQNPLNRDNARKSSLRIIKTDAADSESFCF